MKVSDIYSLSDEKAAEVIAKIAKVLGEKFDYIDVSIGHKFDDEFSTDVRIASGFHDRTIFIRPSKSSHASQGQIIIKDGRIVGRYGFLSHSGMGLRHIHTEIYNLFPNRTTCMECNGYTTCDYGDGAEPPHYVGAQETCVTCKGSGMFAPYKMYQVQAVVQIYENNQPGQAESVTYWDIEENCPADAIATAKRRLGVSGRR